MDEVFRTIVISFMDVDKYKRFLNYVKRGGILSKYLKSYCNQTIWFTFDSVEFRNGMMDTLKSTVTSYNIIKNNNQ